MSDSSQSVRIIIASYLEPHHVDRIRAVNPRLDVMYEPHLLPRPRFAADHVGHAFERPEEDEKRWVSLLGRGRGPIRFRPNSPGGSSRARTLAEVDPGDERWDRPTRCPASVCGANA